MKQVEVMEKILLAAGNEDVEKEQEAFLLKYEKIAEKINSIEELTEYKEKEVLLISDREDFYKAAVQLQMAFLLYINDLNTSGSFPKAPYAITSLEGIGLNYMEQVYKRFHHIPWNILDTAHLKVREMTVDDLDSLYEVYNHPSITRYMEGLYEDREKEAAYTRDYIKNVYGFYGYGLWIVEEKDSGQIIGRAGLSHREGYEEPELGYVIGKKYQNKGYATEVCKAILKYGTKEFGFKHFNAFVHKDNGASIRICEKCGMNWKEQVRIEDELLERYYI